MKISIPYFRLPAVLLCALVFCISIAQAQTTAFTYQGKLTDGSATANGTYQMQFSLFDAPSGGTQIGSTQTVSSVTVIGGTFSAPLDFGATAFDGAARYIEISVKKAADPGYTVLTPRQQITSAPYAIRALSAASADTAATAATAASAANADHAATADSATTATSAATAATASSVSSSAADSVVTAVNAGSSSITTAHVQGDVEILPATAQTATQPAGSITSLLDLKLVGTGNLGTSGSSDLLSLKARGTYNFYNGASPSTRDQERFRFDNTGGFAAFGETDLGSIPAEGAGTRFMWMPYKSAIRAGYVNGTQWDDANIGYYSTAFGYNARASGDYGFAAGRESVAANIDSIALGNYITASGAACVAMGYYAHCNTRQGSFVFSDRSVVDDGNFATDESFKAAVNHSFNVRATGGLWFFTNTAVNTGLRLSHLLPSNTSYGSFIWTDRSSDTAVAPTSQNQTIFRSSGGYWLYSNSGLSAGVTLAPGGGSWNSLSDRNMKENFQTVDARDILHKVMKLPITTWNYKSQAASIRHIGAMAQDFKAEFGVGENDKTIATIDPDGVAFAAIQGLNEELKDELKTRDARIAAQQQQIDELKTIVCSLKPEAAPCQTPHNK